ncbi:unnamed protein product [Rotaria socialis]|uniref:Uncharacterized protein n=1 Tax=Rotaria socialis TaxID=392032 RepID=A0A821H4F3_9BILA|nr:unnamed protein product [Rotaria socialis]CAF3723489.1 unnamed protein product [Rotaria socialis]CAF4677552.1 unnamed protein product [Rotaria socialis]CAF4687129.1 unnamed protein product [Rotaria socialis]
MDNDDENMLCLSVPEKVDTNDDFPSSDDSDIEVTSTINEEENELVQIGNNLCFNSDDSTDDDMNIQDNSTVQSYPAARTSEDDESYDSDHIVDNSSSRLCSLQSEANDTPWRKRKRRGWNKLKLNAAQSRIIYTRLTWEAWRRTLNSIDLEKGFTEIEYTWTDCSIVAPRTLPGYIYDPNKESKIQPNDHDDDIQNHTANEANLANQQHTQVMLKNGGKQLKLDELWEKNNYYIYVTYVNLCFNFHLLSIRNCELNKKD